jgi:galactonate dehydratase
MVETPLAVKDGFLLIPETPGIGIEFSADSAQKHPPVPRPIGTRLHEDGSVVDQ